MPSFHPDKQPLDLRAAAIKQYDKIHTAHGTLIEPKKRVVYDMLGEKEMKAEWGPGCAMYGKRGAIGKQKVFVKAMDAEESRRWFLITMKRREKQMLEDMVQTKARYMDCRPSSSKNQSLPGHYSLVVRVMLPNR
jgi:DnaJ family protein C protein 11